MADKGHVRFTLKQLLYFSAVARTGQISLAAAEAVLLQQGAAVTLSR
jgi:DNA-binding transcriptional LysR family regulator